MSVVSETNLLHPQLPDFEVVSNVETDGSLVLFDLVYDNTVIQCSMTADVVTKTREVAYIPSRYGSNYQYEDYYYQDYEQLVVSEEKFVFVVDNTDIPTRITLTKNQVDELNKQLEYLVEEGIE